MSLIQKNKSAIIRENISFYNEIAGEYDQVMDADGKNELVRNKLKEKLQQLLPRGTVLDFGGGTGLDLQWLTAAGYEVLFCEPSKSMREKAIALNDNSLYSDKVVFLDPGKTDFTKWLPESPFTQKTDAIIANFGVINYIPDLAIFFRNLSYAVKPGGSLLLVTLRLPFRKRMRWHRRNALWSMVTGTTFVFYIFANENRQIVFAHSIRKIRRAAARYFEFHASEPVYDFTLIHLTRK